MLYIIDYIPFEFSLNESFILTKEDFLSKKEELEKILNTAGQPFTYLGTTGGDVLSINDKIKTENILLLDDLGAEKQTDWVLEILYRLINYRYEQMLPTFFSSNYSLQELSEKIGDRVVSRIVEKCDIVKIEGEDRRLLRK